MDTYGPEGLAAGGRPGALLEQMAARRAFAEGTARLYEALIARRRAEGEEGVPTERLRQMRDDEQRHAELLREELAATGAEPTTLSQATAAARAMVSAIERVIADPDCTLPQGLESLLLAELGDGEAWRRLVDLAHALGDEALSSRFEAALSDGERHVGALRGWIDAAVFGEAGLAPPDGGKRARRREPGGHAGERRRARRAEADLASGLGVLVEQHRELARTFKKLAREATRSGRRLMLRRLVEQLALHGDLEERLFYPLVGGEAQDELLARALRAHREIRRLASELSAVEVSDARFEPRLLALRDVAEAHFDEEEAGLFARAEEVLGRLRVEELGAALAARIAERSEAPPALAHGAEAPR